MAGPEHFNFLWRNYPHAILQSFRLIAGYFGKVGNSEVGHASLGAGRIIYQDSVDISRSIGKGSFYRNEVLIQACQIAKQKGRRLHLIGMISDGAIHSHTQHLYALLQLIKGQGVENVFIHGILDGIDSMPTDGLGYIKNLDEWMTTHKIGKIATLAGRYFAMDRDGNLDRVAKAYQAMVLGTGKTSVLDPPATLYNSYKNNFDDYNLPPIVFIKDNKPLGNIREGDVVICFNFRADRMRQLVRSFLDPGSYRKFLFFRTLKVLKIHLVTLTSYHLEDLPLKVAFKPARIKNHLTEVLAAKGFKQLHVAESEKAAHVSYFFNGGIEEPYPGEKRIIVPSSKVANLTSRPEMSAENIKKATLHGIKSSHYDFILVNFANVDMVAHTGNIEAVVKAITTVDDYIDEISKEVIRVGGACFITADHGNAEQVVQLQQADPETLHTLNPVPLILVSADRERPSEKIGREGQSLLAQILTTPYTLADVAPSILDLLNIPKPREMTGQSLLDDLH